MRKYQLPWGAFLTRKFLHQSLLKCQILRLTFKKKWHLKCVSYVVVSAVIMHKTLFTTRDAYDTHTNMHTQAQTHIRSFRLIWWMRLDRWYYYLGRFSVRCITLAFQMHLFFVGKVVITGVYCQPESSRAACICTHPHLHPASMNLTYRSYKKYNWTQFYFGNMFLTKKKKKKSMHIMNKWMCLFTCLPSSSMKRPMLLFHASGLWSKPTFVTRRSSRKQSCICKPKEPQITNLVSHLPLSSFLM